MPTSPARDHADVEDLRHQLTAALDRIHRTEQALHDLQRQVNGAAVLGSRSP